MAQIPDSGFVVQTFRGRSGPLPSLALTCAIVVLLLATSWAQAQSAPASNPIGKNKPTAASPVGPQEVDLPPVPPPPPLTVEQKPPQPPTVAWDGKLLTIDAENSTLAAVLVAVRERTGAAIEIPGGASGERVFVHLGPGPARDIISSLLYGTSFDYIIEAADDDPDTLRSVVLTAHGLGDSSGDIVVAEATNTGEGSDGGDSTPAADAHRSRATEPLAHPERARMMRGWASPGKPTSQAEAEATLAAQQAAKEQESAAGQDSAATQESAAAQVPAAQEPAAADASTAAAEDMKASNSSPSTSDSDDQSGIGHAIHDMTRMFEQRRQLQSQQNHAAQQPSSN